MSLYYRVAYPLLSHIDAETAHDSMLFALALAQRSRPGRWLLRTIAGRLPQRPVQLAGLTFPNVLGVAAGFDKDARITAGLAALGFGHVEVGTLTPRPQTGNERPRIFRLPADHALINRMGFPNDGVEAAVARLRWTMEAKHHFVLGVSLGKQRETPLEEAAGDYAAIMREVYSYADYLAVNISSPNTPGLRALQGSDYLRNLLAVLVAESTSLAVQHRLPRRPLLVKIAPDLAWPEVDEILAAVTASGVDGLIATNTTTRRDGVSSPAQVESGGLSGRPLRERSNEIIAYVSRQTGGRCAIIGVGGVFDAADVQVKLDAGASLVQLYTALVYEGPGLPGRILRALNTH
jgi:dihydroorotate dehydrogenase